MKNINFYTVNDYLDTKLRTITDKMINYQGINVIKYIPCKENQDLIEFMEDHQEDIVKIDNGEESGIVSFFCIDDDTELLVRLMV